MYVYAYDVFFNARIILVKPVGNITDIKVYDHFENKLKLEYAATDGQIKIFAKKLSDDVDFGKMNVMMCVYNENGLLIKVQKAQTEELSNVFLFSVTSEEDKSRVVIWYNNMHPVCDSINTELMTL